MKKIVHLRNLEQGAVAFQALKVWVGDQLRAGREVVITAKPPTRSLEQNARMWAMLGEVSAQVDWYGKKLSAEDWKHVFSASLRRLEVVPNLDGSGFVALGLSTSQMTVGEMNDLMTLMESFGAERGVKFSASDRQ